MQGMKVRLMIAVVIALFSLVSYFASGSENPITGEVQRVSMSPSQEIALGVQAAPEMARQHGGLHPDKRAQDLVDRIGINLLSALKKYMQENNLNVASPYKFEFHLLADSKTINAFALPGGQVFMTAALFQKLKNEDQLAGVIGHEIGHVVARHGAQRVSQQKLTQGLAGAAGVLGGSQESARMAMMVANVVNMKYGRGDELESDRWGIRLCHWAGYDPRAMLGVMDVLDAANNGRAPPEMMSTHPKPANRKAYIRQVLEEEFPGKYPLE
jgi:predicted Zn-dependent protease